MTDTRIEKDSMGELHVPLNARYGAQTQRAINNFPISGQPMPETFIRALVQIKSAAAKANGELDVIPKTIANAIVASCSNLLQEQNILSHFPVDVYQTGSGTSSNMNANEVLANMASEICSEQVSANDHINAGQSSNDVIPTAIHVSATLAIEHQLLPALIHLRDATLEKAATLHNYIKTGRTHLMDAMPVKMSQSVSAWAGQIAQHIQHIEALLPSLKALPQGGTAVGTGINAHKDFSTKFCLHLSKATNCEFTPAENFFTLISAQDTAVSVSGQLKSVATSLIKISNDLRWMNSGPLAGLGEIELEALQPGSSIMPGKVNPVIPEACVMLSAQVIGNDVAITLGGQSGNFELNVALPMIANNLLSSIQLLSNGSLLLADKAISSFKVNQQNLERALVKNPILVTSLNPIIGYMKAAEIAKKAYQTGRPVLEIAIEETDLDETHLKTLLDPKQLT